MCQAAWFFHLRFCRLQKERPDDARRRDYQPEPEEESASQDRSSKLTQNVVVYFVSAQSSKWVATAGSGKVSYLGGLRRLVFVIFEFIRTCNLTLFSKLSSTSLQIQSPSSVRSVSDNESSFRDSPRYSTSSSSSELSSESEEDLLALDEVPSATLSKNDEKFAEPPLGKFFFEQLIRLIDVFWDKFVKLSMHLPGYYLSPIYSNLFIFRFWASVQAASLFQLQFPLWVQQRQCN